MKRFVAPLALLLLVAVAALPALAAGSSKKSEKHPFTLTGQVVSISGSTIVIKVSKAPKALARFEQKGELTLVLAPKATIKIGKKQIVPTALKPQERVSVRGWYTEAAKPTIEATTVIVLAAR